MWTIIHLDLDCFFVSCERIKNPSLAGKPVIVGGNRTNRGVVSSASYEARTFGIRSAMPTAQAKQLCPHGIFLSPDFDCYSKRSSDVEKFLNEVAPVVEQASIDEFYLDLTGCHRVYPDLLVFGSFVKEYLAKELKLPATIGISTSKLVSKIAVAQAKPDGLIQIKPGKEAGFLAPLSVGEMPGIGKTTQHEMAELGVKTLGQIAASSEIFLKQHFGTWGLEFKTLAMGIDDRPVIPWAEPKSIGRETTFEHDIGDSESLISVLSSFLEECSAELRKYRFKAKTVTVKFRLPDFTTFERSKTISATDNEREIYRTVETLFLKNWKPNMKLRLVGMNVSHFVRSEEMKDLFEDVDLKKRQQLAKQVDRIRAQYGFEAVHLGSSLRAS